MPNYQNSIIYKIYGKNHDMVYYGSTTRKLYKRKAGHTAINNSCISKKIIETKDFIFEIVEKFPCNNKKELNEREEYYIKNFDCINLTHKGQSQKEWYQNNKDRILEDRKEYSKKNKDKIKKWRIENKDKINLSNKKYRDRNKKLLNEKRKKKIICSCGISLRKDSIKDHLKTKKHAKLLNKKI